MDDGSLNWIRRTLYAVLIGVSPILLGLILIAVARLIIHRLEIAYQRRQKSLGRRSSSILFQTGRPTLSYTPVSNLEMKRIIQGNLQSSTTMMNNETHPSKNFSTSLASRHDFSSSTLANLVIRPDVLDTAPFTALLAPISFIAETSNVHQSDLINVQHDCPESRVLATLQTNRSKIYDFYESDCTDSLLKKTSVLSTKPSGPSSMTEESFEYHSARSLPYCLDRLNTTMEHDC